MDQVSKSMYCPVVNKNITARYRVLRDGTPSKIVSSFFNHCNAEAICKYCTPEMEFDNGCVAYRQDI